VTVPTNKVTSKREQYRRPPEAGSVIVKDEGETWDVKTPTLRGADATHDMKAVRQMIDAGSGYPPHWRGEPQDANLATAQAMQAPTERHLARRQQYFLFILQDILYHAYQRAVQIEKEESLSTNDYSKLFTADLPDISRRDYKELAGAAHELGQAMRELKDQLPGESRTLRRLIARLIFKFAGEPQDDETLDKILEEGDGEPPSGMLRCAPRCHARQTTAGSQ
jgi:hypothetical protein